MVETLEMYLLKIYLDTFDLECSFIKDFNPLYLMISSNMIKCINPNINLKKIKIKYHPNFAMNFENRFCFRFFIENPDLYVRDLMHQQC